jgi:aryl-alcohol dehydrogenase-like predicted oxidoreductase
LNKAYELGCTFFDTADIYGHGHSEELIGQALKGWNRDEVVLATKVGGDFYSPPSPQMNFSDSYIRFALEHSLQRLKTDRIDLYQLHNPPLELVQEGLIFETLQALQSEGKIRFYGISIFDPMEGVQAIDVGHVQTVQAVYNLFDRRPERALFRHCLQTQTGLIAREPLANGFLTGKFTQGTTFEKGDIRFHWPKPYLYKRIESANRFRDAKPTHYPSLAALALKFVLVQPAVSVVIPGCKTPEQVIENFRASELLDLTPQDLAAIEATYGALV